MAAREYRCIVRSFQMVTPTVFELGFDAENAEFQLDYVAGQFISIVIPGAGPGGRDLRRAYSIASNPERRPVELCIKIVEAGPGTTYLSGLKPGEAFRGFAPYGDFVYRDRPGRHVCFVATGTGLAPFRAIALSKAYQASPPASALCLAGVRHEEELLYPELLSLKLPGFRHVQAVSQPSDGFKGFKGRVTDYLRTLDNTFPWLETEYYLCGNGAMIAEVKAMLLEKGVAKESVHQEKYY